MPPLPASTHPGRKQHRPHYFLLLGLIVSISACSQPENTDEPKQPQPPPPKADEDFSWYAPVDTSTWAITLKNEYYLLENRVNKRTYKIAETQLLPPKSTPDQEPQLDVLYDPKVMAIKAGKTLICLYLSSYQVSDGGSLALAEGYDIFVFFDLKKNRVLPQVLHLGRTRGRHKSMGFMDAQYTHFFISYPGADSMVRIGTRLETMGVTYDKERPEVISGPYHDIGPLKWYQFNGSSWEYNPKLDRMLPVGTGSGELPPTLPVTPLELVAASYRKRSYSY